MPKPAHPQLKVMTAAVLLAVSFAFMGVWVRMMADSFGAFQQVYLRILLAGVVGAVVWRRHISRDVWRRITARDWGIYAGRGFMAFTVGVAGLTIAVEHTKLSTVSFVSNLPIMGLLGWVMFREKVRLVTLPFIGLSLVGLLLITGTGLRDFHWGIGELAAIICMLGFDIGFLMSRLHRPSFNNFQNTTILLLVGWIPVFIISLLVHEPLVPAHVSAAAWVGLLLSVIANVAGLYVINYVFAHLKAYVAGNLFLLEGVFALVVGLVLYGEVPTRLELVGAVIILGCAYAISALDVHSTPRIDD